MDTKATATLIDGKTVHGRLTTAHAASSYGQPVFVDEAGQAYNWAAIASIDTAAAALGAKGGRSTSPAKRAAAAVNGRKGGRKPKTE